MFVAIKYFVLMASIFPIVLCIQSESLAAAVHLDNPQARSLHIDSKLERRLFTRFFNVSEFMYLFCCDFD
jgi:hypothetical protein